MSTFSRQFKHCCLVLIGLWQVNAMGQAKIATQGAFAVSPSGAANYNLQLEAPPGLGGMEPQLSVGYSSQAGNGVLGVGWRLGGLSVITRRPKSLADDGVSAPVRYDDSDRYCIDGKKLVATTGVYGANATVYRPQMDVYKKVVKKE